MVRIGGMVVIGLLVAGCGKLPLDAKVKGYKPGSNSIVLVDVKSNTRATIECVEPGVRCEKKDVGATGVATLEIDLAQAVTMPATVVLHAKHGPRENTATVVLDATSGLATKVEVSPTGLVTCSLVSCRGQLDLAPRASLVLTTVPGTKVALGASAPAPLDAKGVVPTTFDVAPFTAVRGLPLRSLCADTSTKLGTAPLTLTFPDQTAVSTEVTLTTENARAGIRKALAALPKGAANFPWETAGTKLTKRGVLLLDGSGCTPGGPADATLSDLAVVVLTETKERADKCEYKLTDQKTQKDQGNASSTMTLRDLNATAYDRVKGTVLGTRLFAAPKDCITAFATKQGDRMLSQRGSVDPAVMIAWAAGLQ